MSIKLRSLTTHLYSKYKHKDIYDRIKQTNRMIAYTIKINHKLQQQLKQNKNEILWKSGCT